MATYDELYDKKYKEITDAGIDIEDCELEWGSQSEIELTLTDPKSGAQTTFTIDLSEYFGSVYDLPGIEENIEYYFDIYKLIDERAQIIAEEYAEEFTEDEEEDE